MAPLSRQQDEYQLQEEATLYSSLCLLEAQNAEGAKQVDLSKAMFRKPNPKAFELILYHTYTVVKGKAAAKKLFKGLWPLVDKDRKQSKEFYQRVGDWLKDTRQLEAHGNSLAPFIRNPSGPKLVSFLCDLTFYALQAQHERLCPADAVVYNDQEDSQMLLAIAEPLVTAARAQNQLQAQRLTKACQHGANVQQEAEQVAAELRDMYYSLTAQVKEAHAAVDTMPAESDLLVRKLEGNVSPSLSGMQPHPPQLPAELLAAQQQLEQLWVQLEAHSKEFAGMAGLVDALAGCDVHPHAIDGAKLREAGQLPGAPSTAGLDIAAMMEAWLVDVGAVCRYIKYLAGQPEADSEQQQLPLGTWGSGGGATPAGSRGSTVTPLVATSDAASHAPHLYAQLGLHSACLDHMRGMKSKLGQRMAATAERIQQLEVELYDLMAEEEQRCLAAMEAAAADAAVLGLRDSSGAAQYGVHHNMSAAARPLFSETQVAAGAGKPSLFNSSSLQLVPPTPMLQQLVHKHRSGNDGSAQQQQPQLNEAELAAAPAATTHELSPGRLSFGSLDECGSSSSGGPSIPPAAAEGLVDSPRLHSLDTNRAQVAATLISPSSSISSVGSMSCPAATLLMSQDIMDLQLVDDEDLYVPTSPVVRRAEDPLRLSMLRLSIRHDSMAAAVSRLGAAGATEHADSSQVEGTANAGRVGSPGGLAFSLPAVQQLSMQGALAAHKDDTPPHIGRAKTSSSMDTGGEANHEPGIETVGDLDADGVDVNIAADHDADDVCNTVVSISASVGLPAENITSPAIIQAAHLDPMAALPTGSDRMSSARPRRLTFAAAVSDNTSSMLDYAPGGQILSPGSSEVSSGDAGGEGESASSRQQPTAQHMEGQSLSLLRQRFLATQANKQ